MSEQHINSNSSNYESQLRKLKKEYEAKQRRIRRFYLCLIGIILIISTTVIICIKNGKEGDYAFAHGKEITSSKYIEEWPDFNVELLDVNEYSRPGTALEEVKSIVVHYTANPGSTAEQNRNYFNNLATTGETSVSAHFVIGLEGEVIQCIPCDEIAYASNYRNKDSISIECCHPDETGKFNDATYDSLVELTAWLVGRYDLEIDDVIRHYDVKGKECPLYFVEHEDKWEQFKLDVLSYIENNGTEK